MLVTVEFELDETSITALGWRAKRRPRTGELRKILHQMLVDGVQQRETEFHEVLREAVNRLDVQPMLLRNYPRVLALVNEPKEERRKRLQTLAAQEKNSDTPLLRETQPKATR